MLSVHYYLQTPAKGLARNARRICMYDRFRYPECYQKGLEATRMTFRHGRQVPLQKWAE